MSNKTHLLTVNTFANNFTSQTNNEFDVTISSSTPNDPHIFIIEDNLQSDIINNIMSTYNSNTHLSQLKVGTYPILLNNVQDKNPSEHIREINISSPQLLLTKNKHEWRAFDFLLEKLLQDNFNTYFQHLKSKCNNSLNQFETNFMARSDEGFFLQKFEKNNGFLEWNHNTDTLMPYRQSIDTLLKMPGVPAFNFLWFLNDIEDEHNGKLLFVNGSVKPKKGSFVIWPASWNYIFKHPKSTADKFVISGKITYKPLDNAIMKYPGYIKDLNDPTKFSHKKEIELLKESFQQTINEKNKTINFLTSKIKKGYIPSPFQEDIDEDEPQDDNTPSVNLSFLSLFLTSNNTFKDAINVQQKISDHTYEPPSTILDQHESQTLSTIIPQLAYIKDFDNYTFPNDIKNIFNLHDNLFGPINDTKTSKDPTQFIIKYAENLYDNVHKRLLSILETAKEIVLNSAGYSFEYDPQGKIMETKFKLKQDLSIKSESQIGSELTPKQIILNLISERDSYVKDFLENINKAYTIKNTSDKEIKDICDFLNKYPSKTFFINIIAQLLATYLDFNVSLPKTINDFYKLNQNQKNYVNDLISKPGLNKSSLPCLCKCHREDDEYKKYMRMIVHNKYEQQKSFINLMEALNDPGKII
jgi:hypothetical protein|tara:strand:- start:554 stop:2476 length:1923 start_codon:yes stop_codon:yes gene_type:complete